MRLKREFIYLMPAAFLFWGLVSVEGLADIGNNSKDITTAQNSQQIKSDMPLPLKWLQAWSDPTAELRPLQILHGIGVKQATPAWMTTLKKLGLGGIVCNVDFNDYMVSEANWKTLIRAVEACRKVGLIVWIYDEDGYPSGAAGGLVLKRNPAFEALALTYDPSSSRPFKLRPAYEYTHASNNYHAARRYPNLIDKEAIRCFIETTHEAYWHRLKEHFGTTIRALFTDEPSLMAVNIGPLPDNIRKNVRVVDPLDVKVKPLPSVPWVRDLPMRYRERYGQDIMGVRRSLFEGNDESDRQVRRRFWSLISNLIADRYFGQIQEWARAHGVVSSGHTLWEEMPLHHVPLEGSALKVLGRMDIPGLDMLSSEPEVAIYSGWLTASLPASAALFNGGRKVMTEVSDFAQIMAGKGPASLADRQATAGWQAALGVTEFALYYSYPKRTGSPVADILSADLATEFTVKHRYQEQKAKDYRAYCDFVGRLNAMLREAQPAPHVLLYYPIYDFWSEYMPVAEKLTLGSQSQKTRHIVKSFLEFGQRMVREQISFAVADHELLGVAKVRKTGMWIGGHRFGALVLPAEVQLPKSVVGIVERFKTAGGKVIRGKVAGPGIDFGALGGIYPNGALDGRSDRIVVGRFIREGKDILLMVNVADKPYVGKVTVKTDLEWFRAYPVNAKIEHVKIDGTGRVAISLPARGAVLLIGSPLSKQGR